MGPEAEEMVVGVYRYHFGRALGRRTDCGLCRKGVVVPELSISPGVHKQRPAQSTTTGVSSAVGGGRIWYEAGTSGFRQRDQCWRYR